MFGPKTMKATSRHCTPKKQGLTLATIISGWFILGAGILCYTAIAGLQNGKIPFGFRGSWFIILRSEDPWVFWLSTVIDLGVSLWFFYAAIRLFLGAVKIKAELDRLDEERDER